MMKRAKQVAVVGVGTVVVVLVGAVAAFGAKFPAVGPARAHEVSKAPERVARGAYLANHVTVCVDCHSTRDWSRFSGPITPNTTGMGGERFGRELGFPGEFYAANITPSGVGRYTDGELERVITTGVTKEGRAIFPVMPYPRYAGLCQDDVDAIIAYVRSLSPIENKTPAAVLDFPMNVLVKTIPAEQPRPPCPDRSDVVASGRYLANAAACAECHTQFERGEFLPGMDYAGGRPFPMPGGTVRSANLTADVATGIGGWSEATFLARMRGHAEVVVKPGDMQTMMPWTMYAGMTDDDLKAIYAFLRTIPAKANAVTKWTPERSPTKS